MPTFLVLILIEYMCKKKRFFSAKLRRFKIAWKWAKLGVEIDLAKMVGDLRNFAKQTLGLLVVFRRVQLSSN